MKEDEEEQKENIPSEVNAKVSPIEEQKIEENSDKNEGNLFDNLDKQRTKIRQKDSILSRKEAKKFKEENFNVKASKKVPIQPKNVKFKNNF